MKKIAKPLALIIALCLIFSLAACSAKNSGETAATSDSVGESTAPVADSSAGSSAAPADSAKAETGAADGSETTAVSFTDMAGREVNLEAPATRIVALTASDCEILYAIGAGDCLVGRGEYCDYPAEVANVPSVESGYETNIEQIIALEPQVVVLGIMAQTKEQNASLEAAGITVAISDAQDIAGIYDAIEMLGTLTGKTAEAETVAQNMKSTFENIESNPVEEGKTVYFEVSPLEWGLWTAGTGTFMNEVAQLMGLRNCFDDVEGWAEISEEQVLERNPDYIVTISMYYGEGLTPTEEIMSRSGWENVTAVKNGAILNLQNNELSRPAPRLAEGAQALYDFVSGVSSES